MCEFHRWIKWAASSRLAALFLPLFNYDLTPGGPPGPQRSVPSPMPKGRRVHFVIELRLKAIRCICGRGVWSRHFDGTHELEGIGIVDD